MSYVLNVAFPQCLMSSMSYVLDVACPQCLVLNVPVLNVFCPQCPICSAENQDCLVFLWARTFYSMLSIWPAKDIAVMRAASCTLVQVSQKFSTRTNGFVHSSRPLYWPIKRHNWSVPVQPLAQKNWGTQKPQKKRVASPILPNFLLFSQRLLDQTVVGRLDIRIVGCVCPFNCDTSSSVKRFASWSRKSAAGCTKESLGWRWWYSVA